SVTLITSLAIIGNLFLAHKDIQTQLDAELQRNALQIQAFFSDEVSHRNFQIVQKNLNTLLTPPQTKTEYNQTASEQALIAQPEFQIWDKDGHLILHSPGAPTIPYSSFKTQQLSPVFLKGLSWRVYTVFDPKNQTTIMVAERTNYRQELENQLTQDSIF